MEGSLAADFGSRLLGVVIAGGLSGGLACVAVGFLLEAIGRVSGFARSGEGFRRFLAADPVESVRAQAARALWKAPSTFGREPAAAETLAAILDRALEPRALERLTWLALDGAAGPRHPALERAAARFAAATADPELRRAARAAAR